jgi:hypothetical protein
MPDKPTWCGHLPEALAELRALPYPWVDRPTLERVLGVGRRRAQQLLQPCVRQQAGGAAVADREELIRHLEGLASGESKHYERSRRRKFAAELAKLNQAWIEQPKAFVEAPLSIASQRLADLPAGVKLGPGEITLTFSTAVEAMEKLLAIAMAAGNDLDGFESMISKSRFPSTGRSE